MVTQTPRGPRPGGSGTEGGAGPIQGALRGGHRPPPDGPDQLGVVGLGLVGVGPGEPGHGPVQLVGPAGVARDHGGATGAGVPLGQQVTDDAGVVGQRRGIDGVERDGALHVPELPDVVLPLADGGPAEERVAHRLQGLLVLHHPLALVSVPGRVAVHVLGQHRPARLLQLEEQHVVGAAALEQRHVGAQADAADADDLVGDVDQGVAAQDPAPVRRQGAQVLVQRGRDQVAVLLGDVGDQRRLVHDVPTALVLAGEPRQRAVTGPVPGPLGGPLDLGPERLLGGGLVQALHVQTVVGTHEQWLFGQEVHLGAVGRHARHDRVRALLLAGRSSPARPPRCWRRAAADPTPNHRDGPRRSR